MMIIMQGMKVRWMYTSSKWSFWQLVHQGRQEACVVAKTQGVCHQSNACSMRLVAPFCVDSLLCMWLMRVITLMIMVGSESVWPSATILSRQLVPGTAVTKQCWAEAATLCRRIFQLSYCDSAWRRIESMD